MSEHWIGVLLISVWQHDDSLVGRLRWASGMEGSRGELKPAQGIKAILNGTEGWLQKLQDQAAHDAEQCQSNDAVTSVSDDLNA
jgi:hypothetical protein